MARHARKAGNRVPRNASHAPGRSWRSTEFSAITLFRADPCSGPAQTDVHHRRCRCGTLSPVGRRRSPDHLDAKTWAETAAPIRCHRSPQSFPQDKANAPLHKEPHVASCLPSVRPFCRLNLGQWSQHGPRPLAWKRHFLGFRGRRYART